MTRKGIGGHALPNRGRTDDWCTPPEIIQALGPFDLDPCRCYGQRDDTAANAFTLDDDGLSQEWTGRVWLNPPYGSECAQWMRKMAAHNWGTALIFARTETAMFFESVWHHAASILFIQGRLHFHYPDGLRATGNAGGPHCLIAYGLVDSMKLQFAHQCGKVSGRFIRLQEKS